MKFSIKKNILLENLNYVSHAISSKNIIPILGGIKFDLTKDGLNLIASDNEIDIKAFIDKKYIDNIGREGSIVLQGKYLLEIVRKLPDEIINIELIDGFKILIYTTNTQFDLNGINPSEFPNLNIEKTNKPISISKKQFKEMINQTIYAISMQESRPVLTGINIKINDDILECVATDSYRLSKKTFKLDKVIDNPINIVVPGKNMGELVKILNEDDGDVNINIFTNKVLFSFDNILFQSRLLNDVFPNIDRLIPKEYNLIIKTKLNDLFNVVDRVSLLSNEKEKNVIKFNITDNNLIVTSNTPEVGKAEEKLEIEKNNDKDLTISFSSKHMLDALRIINKENVKIYLNTDISPIIIKTDDDADLLQLIMPIKTY